MAMPGPFLISRDPTYNPGAPIFCFGTHLSTVAVACVVLRRLTWSNMSSCYCAIQPDSNLQLHSANLYDLILCTEARRFGVKNLDGKGK